MKHIIISNHPIVWEFCNQNSIDYLMIDLETKDKLNRQANLSTWISDHTIQDIQLAKSHLKSTKLIVRINPIHSESEDEINRVLECKPDIIMLPYFSTIEEVEMFQKFINQRSDVAYLFETLRSISLLKHVTLKYPSAFNYLGLNDLSITMKIPFLFQVLQTRLIDFFSIINKVNQIQFGFGGIGYNDKSVVSPKLIYAKHLNFGSNHVILSREFIRGIDLNHDSSLMKIQRRFDILKSIQNEVDSLDQMSRNLLTDELDFQLRSISKDET